MQSAKDLLTKVEWMILKKGRFSDLEILEIREKVYWEEYKSAPPIHTGTPNVEKQKPPDRIETRNTENRNATPSQSTKQMLSEDNRFRVCIENHDQKEYFITISQETGLGKSQVRNCKKEQNINI